MARRRSATEGPPAADGAAGPEARLARYRSMRDFEATAEPRGGDGAEPGGGAGAAPGPTVGGRFVVQRHRARALHYDLRLEVDGALVSWAVPKGPTLAPGVRSLAVHVEDHPLEYIDFEGTIPAGEYGGGDVIVWDRGTWAPAKDGDPARAIADGELHFDLEGEKLAGRFVLVRTGRPGRRERWLLLHKRDDHAVEGWDPEDHPRSVRSGRTNDEVAAHPEASWDSSKPAAEAEVAVAGPEGAAGPAEAAAPTPRPRRRRRRRLPRAHAPTAGELAALEALGASGTWEVGGQAVRLTNLDKVLFPGTDDVAPLTKRDLVRYMSCVAPAMVPYLAGRPVNMHRYPSGVDRSGFWHKEVPSHAPDWLERWRNEEAGTGETRWYAVVDSTAGLAWMANYAAVELHAWTSTAASPHEPTWAMIDIDPGPSTSFDDVLVLARLYRTALDHLGVVGGPEVTGQRGIQIWVPVAPGATFEATRRWVEKLSRAVGATVPDLVSWAWHRRDRGGLARLDFTQNAVNKTLVAPYSPRPAAGAPVSMPIRWDELDDPGLRPDRWTVRSALDRLAEVGDLFAPLLEVDQALPQL